MSNPYWISCLGPWLHTAPQPKLPKIPEFRETWRVVASKQHGSGESLWEDVGRFLLKKTVTYIFCKQYNIALVLMRIAPRLFAVSGFWEGLSVIFQLVGLVRNFSAHDASSLPDLTLISLKTLPLPNMCRTLGVIIVEFLRNLLANKAQSNFFAIGQHYGWNSLPKQAPFWSDVFQKLVWPNG